MTGTVADESGLEPDTQGLVLKLKVCEHRFVTESSAAESAVGPSLQQAIARQVLRHRSERRWSRKRLAQECESYVAGLTEPSIVNLERAQRRVTVEELLALAAVFGVPPLALMLDAGQSEALAIFDREVPTDALLSWLEGRDGRAGVLQRPWAALPATLEARDVHTLDLIRRHGAAVRAFDLAMDSDEPRDPGAGDLAAVNLVRTLQAEMRRRGETPPRVSDALRAALGE